MSTLVKVNQVDKDLYCHKIYEDSIYDTSEFLATCEEMAKVLSSYIPGGCYTNFRDSLFHFRRMVLSYEQNEINKQAFAVKEHANRAKTDAIISILEQCSNILQIIQKKFISDLDEETIKELKVKKNKLDAYMLNFRLSGMMLEDVAALRPTEQLFINEVSQVFAFINSKVGRDIFHEVIKIMRPGTEKNN